MKTSGSTTALSIALTDSLLGVRCRAVCEMSMFPTAVSSTRYRLAVQECPRRGGVVENIQIHRVNMPVFRRHQLQPVLQLGKANSDDTESVPAGEETPIFRDIVIRDVVCRGANGAIMVRGLPEMPVQRLCFESVSISSRKGAEFTHADSIQLKKCEIIPENGPVIELRDCANVVTG